MATTQSNSRRVETFGIDMAFATPKINFLTIIFFLFTCVGLGAGVYALFVGHHHVYNVSREVPWGLLIAGYIYFAIISTGLCLLSVLGHLFGGTALLPLSNRSLFLSISAILAAFSIIGLELENPWRMYWFAVSPNLTSNIMWMGALYGACLLFMLLEFSLILARKYRIAFVLGILGALSEIAANTNLGAVFALISSRPFWFGGLLPIFFICSALMSGAAALIVFNYIAYKVRRKEMDVRMQQAMSATAKVMLLFLGIVTLATVWRFLAIFTGGSELGRDAAMAFIKGPLSTNFWVFEIGLGLVVPLLLLVGTRTRNIHAMFFAGLATLIGAMFQRYDLVIGGQIVPVYKGIVEGVPEYIHYSPSLGEYLVLLGGVSLLITAFLLGERFFGGLFDHSEH